MSRPQAAIELAGGKLKFLQSLRSSAAATAENRPSQTSKKDRRSESPTLFGVRQFDMRYTLKAKNDATLNDATLVVRAAGADDARLADHGAEQSITLRTLGVHSVNKMS